MIDTYKNKLIFVICGGIHHPQLTDNFVRAFSQVIAINLTRKICIIPTEQIQPYDGVNIYNFLIHQYGQPHNSLPLIFISFSAGVVGCISAAKLWHQQGGIVKCFFALDGWGVPLWANFPCYRLSHDYFTHLTSQLLGGTQDAFYAGPSVSHLDLWRSSNLVQGYWQTKYGRQKITAMNFIVQILSKFIVL